MFTDVVGYTSLTQKDEALAMELLEEHRSLVRPFLQKHGGREVKTIGDAFLVEFESALEAVRCAFDIQQALHEVNMSRPIERKIQLRIGVHLGDVIHSQSDVYGDAVNVASRIEPLAPPGGVCITEQVYDHVKNKSDFQLTSLGKRELKNVGEPVEVFRVVFPWEKKEEASALAPDRMRVAVLPFTNLSSDPEEGYFADGMTEELITSISGVRQLTVIARTSVMGYKGTTKKAKEIGKELEVGTMLEGSVRKAGNRVRITAQLIDSATEGHLWAQNYDRQLEDVFAIQSEIAEKVAEELRVRLVDSEKRVIERRPTDSAEAFTYYLRARELVRSGTEASLRQAPEVFEKAIVLDPSFARAHAGLAESYLEATNAGYGTFEQNTPKAELAANKAVQLDPELAEAHAILAEVAFNVDDVHAGERSAKRAIELNPSLSDAHYILSNLYFLQGETEGGLKAAESCYRLDPVRPRFVERLGFWYFCLGRENDALQHWAKTVQTAPFGTYRSETEYYLAKEDLVKAKEFYVLAEKLEPGHRWVKWMKGFIAARTGDRDGALGVIKEIEAKWVGSSTLNDLAFVYYALDDLDSYFTYVNRSVDQHTYQYAYVMYCPLFSKARDDPRYHAVQNKIRRMIEGS